MPQDQGRAEGVGAKGSNIGSCLVEYCEFRVSEPACLGPAPAPGKKEHNVGIF